MEKKIDLGEDAPNFKLLIYLINYSKLSVRLKPRQAL